MQERNWTGVCCEICSVFCLPISLQLEVKKEYIRQEEYVTDIFGHCGRAATTFRRFFEFSSVFRAKINNQSPCDSVTWFWFWTEITWPNRTVIGSEIWLQNGIWKFEKIRENRRDSKMTKSMKNIIFMSNWRRVWKCHILLLLCILVCEIVLKCICLQYHKEPPVYRMVLKNLNSSLTAVFTVEAILKILAFGVRVSL